MCKKYSCVEKDGEAKLEYNKEKCLASCKKVCIAVYLLPIRYVNR